MRLLTAFLISFCLLAIAPSPRAVAAGESSGQGFRTQVLDAVAQQLTEHFHAKGTLILELQRPWNPPAGNGLLETVVVEFPASLSGTMLVRAKVLSGGELLAEPTLVVRAQLVQEVWVSRTALERERLFDPADFETRRVDVLREREPVATTDSCVDMVFTRPIAAGNILSWRELGKRPLVRRGELVDVAAIDGSLVVVLRALAMESGAAGDVVKVRNPESKKEFKAIVVADARAEIRF